MRAIIIEDKDGMALVDALALSKYQQQERTPEQEFLIGDMHRHFHFVVVRWLQSHGWKVNP